MLKKLLKSPTAITALCHLAALYIRFVFITTKWHVTGKHHLDTIPKDNGIIFAFWHGRMLMIPPFRTKDRDTYALASRHRDGQMIASITALFGCKVVSGSSKKGGVSAIMQAITLLKRGDFLCITPDGPRGPNQLISGHIIDIAQKSGTPIIPLSYGMKRKTHFKSWDRFLFPYPFNRACFLIDRPIYISKKEDADYAKTMLEERLNHLTAQADI